MRLDEVGEFDLIDRILARLGPAVAHDILVPPGDDAAAWAVESGALVSTIDILVEGNHWRTDTMSYADVGWRTVAANVSDLAAMGAEPQYVLVGAMLGPAVSVEDVDAFAEGLADAAQAHGVRVAGGDVVRGSTSAFTIAAYGRATVGPDGAPALLRRDAARPGDAVAVSGAPGASAAGLRAIEQGRGGESAFEALVRAHRRPVARAPLGRSAVAGGVRCAIDVSDGLAQDLGHVARRSGVGVEVAAAALPLHPAAVDLLGRHAALDLALGGGEDFELALCGPRDALKALDTPEVPVTLIGRVVAEHPGEVVIWTDEGEAYEPPARGWDQMRTQATRTGAP